MEAAVVGGGGFIAVGMVDGVGEALGYDVVQVGVDVGLEAKHVGRGEVLGGDEGLPDALVAVGIGPVKGDDEGVVVGGDARVGGGEDSAGRVEGLGKLIEGDVAGPLAAGIERADGDGAGRRGVEEAAADGDAADSVVGDVTLVIGVDEVLGGASPGGEGGTEAGPVGGGVDGEEGVGEVDGVVDSPAEGDAAGVSGALDSGEDGRGNTVVLGGGDVEDDVFVAADVDDFALMEERVPVAVGGLELGAGGGDADALDEEVLDVSAEVGEAPGDVVVVTYDDEGCAGQGDSGDVKGSAGGGGGLEVGLVPDAGDAVGEVHVVGEERLSGGGVGSGDGPVVRAGEAAFTGGSEVE